MRKILFSLSMVLVLVWVAGSALAYTGPGGLREIKLSLE